MTLPSSPNEEIILEPEMKEKELRNWACCEMATNRRISGKMG